MFAVVVAARRGKSALPGAKRQAQEVGATFTSSGDAPGGAWFRARPASSRDWLYRQVRQV
jgi:hypothetical protein